MLKDGGVPAADSLPMSLDGVAGVVTVFRLLIRYGDLAAVFNDFLTLLSAVAIQLDGDCKADSFRGCFMKITVFRGPNRAIKELLYVILVVVVALGLFLRRWRAGAGREHNRART